jgi:hypothetical protein
MIYGLILINTINDIVLPSGGLGGRSLGILKIKNKIIFFYKIPGTLKTRPPSPPSPPTFRNILID